MAHWRHIRTNNPLEYLNREIRRRTRVVGNFPDGHAVLMLVSCPPALYGRPKVGHATVYEHEPRNLVLKPGTSMPSAYPGFIDWLLQNERKILGTTGNTLDP